MDKVIVLSNPYKRLGVRRAINAAGILTRIGGSRSPSQVQKAMEAATESFVTISELQLAAGKVIADAMGAEAGLPTAGGSAAILLASAACIMKGSELENYEPKGPAIWRHIARRLPLQTDGLPTEFIVQKWNRDEYDHAVECAGGHLVEVGENDRVTTDDLRLAYRKGRTAAYYYTVTVKSHGIPLEDYIKIAHEMGAPVIVDACAEPPPKTSLKKYTGMGADLVAISGGKVIAGPNNTGLLAGRRDLIKLAHLQSYPFEGVGRPAKMSRESICGLIAALDHYIAQDEETVFREQEEKISHFINQIKVPGVETWIEYAMSGDGKSRKYPLCCIRTNELVFGYSTRSLYEALLELDPSVVTIYEPYFLLENYKGLFSVCALFLSWDELNYIAESIRKFGITHVSGLN